MNADLEQVFESIEKGNTLCDDKKYWEAATAYTEARRQLLSLVQENSDAAAAANGQDSTEAAQIRELYKRQARDYLHRARKTLLDALEQEDAADQALELDQPTRHEQFTADNANIKDDGGSDTSLERLRLFAWLFANEDSLQVSLTNTTTNSIPTAQLESSLEDRFRALSASLPQSVKTSDERMRDLNKGLRHLGISVPASSYSSKPKQELFELNARSEVDQVEDIIEQAKDEARMEELHPSLDKDQPPTSTTNGMTDNSDSVDAAGKLVDSMIDAVEAARSLQKHDEDDDNDSMEDPGSGSQGDTSSNRLTADDLAYFQDRVNEAQACLAEFNAMLDRDDEAEDEEDVGLLFDADTGKHALDSALRYLQQVQKRWKDSKKQS